MGLFGIAFLPALISVLTADRTMGIDLFALADLAAALGDFLFSAARIRCIVNCI